MRFSISLLLVLTCFLLPAGLFADLGVPPGKPGELAYIPYPVKIVLDGKTDDWAGIPSYTVATGPYVSPDPYDNGQFTWAICADMKNIYMTMSMPDKMIIGGAHGTDFWNEDSFEFYFNLSGNLDAMAYGPGIVQANINATNISATDPRKLSLTGVRFAEEGYDVSGYAFQTESGWAVELAMKLDNNMEPYHGFTVGMQFQANGAVKKDRDSKLIWSIYDTADTSWKNPKLFGTGVFFKLGSTDVPEPARKNLPKVVVPKNLPLDKLPLVRVNQHGYLTSAAKKALVVSEASAAQKWEILNKDSVVLASGMTTPLGVDPSTANPLHLVDFSSFRTEGSDFVLRVGDRLSFPFAIGGNIYQSLMKDAMAFFYRSRSGIALDPALAGEPWAHEAWYSSDEATKPFAGKDASGKDWPARPYVLNAAKGWFDAGDYGKYVVNGGISVWTLLNLYERNPGRFADGTMAIPEAGNAIPDILDEARWEMDFMMGMQVPQGAEQEGMVHHKLHEPTWSPLPFRGEERVDNRFAYPPSTAATLNLAAAAGQMARLMASYDKAYADKCLLAAERAWDAAQREELFHYGNIPGNGGGNYDDAQLEDEFFWAAAELFITTGKDSYRQEVLRGLENSAIRDAAKAPNGPMSWGRVAVLGQLSLVLNTEKLAGAMPLGIPDLVRAGADFYLEQIGTEGYLVPMAAYEWGSNSSIMNKLLIMAYAYDASGDQKYLDGMAVSMDYVLGRNGLSKSFVSGYGENPVHYLHHRFWADAENEGFPVVPPGLLSGGPNETAYDEATTGMIPGTPRALRYADDLRSYSTNEVAINWNAPLVWVAAYLDEKSNPEAGVKVMGKEPVNFFVLGVSASGVIILAALVFLQLRRSRKKS